MSQFITTPTRRRSQVVRRFFTLAMIKPTMDGISGTELAQNLQKILVSNLGLTDRGAKAKPELAVLRRTIMPAVIIEGAFISNPNDLEFMKTDEFRELYAKSVAKCIIEVLNESVE